jgi:hypothetical protein
VPILLIGLALIFAGIKFNNSGNWHLSRVKLRNFQVKLDTQQPQPLYLAAKDDRKKECLWLGICDGKDKKYR